MLSGLASKLVSLRRAWPGQCHTRRACGLLINSPSPDGMGAHGSESRVDAPGRRPSSLHSLGQSSNSGSWPICSSDAPGNVSRNAATSGGAGHALNLLRCRNTTESGRRSHASGVLAVRTRTRARPSRMLTAPWAASRILGLRKARLKLASLTPGYASTAALRLDSWCWNCSCHSHVDF